MANNRIQIRRSVANATVSGLLPGELAFTQASNTLYIGMPSGNTVLRIGGAQYPGLLTNNQALVANSTGGINRIITTNVSLTTLIANNSTGIDGYVLYTTGSTAYWGLVKQVLGGSGLSDSSNDSSCSIHFNAGNGLQIAGDDTVVVRPGSTLSVNSSGVHVNSQLSINDLNLSGNLTVQGTFTTLNSQTISISDPLIELAKNQTNTVSFTDSSAIGFYGSYGNTSNVVYTGLFRDQTDGVYKLFFGQVPTPTTSVNTSNANFSFGILQSWLKSGGFISNSSTISVTANSSLAVSFIANSLLLSTALPSNSGGTGYKSFVNNAILVGNSSSGLTQLELGTDGLFLQSNGSALVYGVFDGGIF